MGRTHTQTAAMLESPFILHVRRRKLTREGINPQPRNIARSQDVGRWRALLSPERNVETIVCGKKISSRYVVLVSKVLLQSAFRFALVAFCVCPYPAVDGRHCRSGLDDKSLCRGTCQNKSAKEGRLLVNKWVST